MIKQFLLLGVVLFSSCTIAPNSGADREVYYVKSDGVNLPVIVSGQNTKDILFYVHGGPGSTSLQLYYTPFMDNLKKKYRVVMYDQRGSGGSRGNASEASLTLDQHVKDLNAVINSVKLKYPDSNIYMMGISYGGMVSSAYASQYQNNLKGLILLVPALNLVDMSTNIAANMIGTFIDPFLSRNDISQGDRDFWQGAKQFYQDNIPLNLDAFLTHNSYISDAYPIHIPVLKQYDEFNKELLQKVIADPMMEPLAIQTQVKLLLQALDKNGESKRNLETDPKFTLSKITIPSMMITGDRDLTVPPISSINSYKTIGSTTKRQLQYAGVGHDLALLEPNKLFNDIDTFISDTKNLSK